MPPSPVASCARASQAAAPRSDASSDGRSSAADDRALRIRYAAAEGFHQPASCTRRRPARKDTSRTVSQLHQRLDCAGDMLPHSHAGSRCRHRRGRTGRIPVASALSRRVRGRSGNHRGFDASRELRGRRRDTTTCETIVSRLNPGRFRVATSIPASRVTVTVGDTSAIAPSAISAGAHIGTRPTDRGSRRPCRPH